MMRTRGLLGGVGALVLVGGLAASCGETGSDDGRDELVAASTDALTPGPGEVCVNVARGVGTVSDAWISAASPGANNGASTTLTTGGTPVGSVLVKFDVSAIPSTATITRGFMRVNQTYNGNAPVDPHLITAPWSEGTVTYSSFGNAFNPAPFTSLVTGPGPIPALYFDMVAPLQAWVSGSAPNHGVLLNQGLTGQRIVRSSEDSIPSYRPTLQFCYTDLCSNVTCTASDACHVAGTCDPLTGQCSNPPAPNGTPCNDSNVCTTSDNCQNGTCTGTPVTPPGPGPSGPATMLAPFQDPIGVAVTKNQLLLTRYCDFPNHLYYMDDLGNTSIYADIPTPNDGCIEEYLATSPGLGGFIANEVFVTHGQQVYRVDNAQNVTLFATLAGLGGTHTGIAFDHSGLFGYDMIVSGNTGVVYRVNSAGVATQIANIGVGVEGPDVAPLTFAPYGGHILLAAEGVSAVYAIGPAPSYTVSFVGSWPSAESIHVIPPNPCSYGATGSAFFSAIYPSLIEQYPAGNFAGLAGDILVTSEGGGIGIMHSNGSSISFSQFYGNVGQHEGSAFVDCSVPSSCN